MNNKWIKSIVLLGALAVVTTGCLGKKDMAGMDHSNMPGMDMASPSPNATAASSGHGNMKMVVPTPVLDASKEITITAQASNMTAADGKMMPVWTFNNSVPGPQIRAKVGDTIKVVLKNELDDPVSIHWHGYPVPNTMDGIPGMTQDAVVKGKSFTYEFKATIPGTYWYHSHQDSVNQLDKGLYGSLIVEDPNEKFDRDYTLVLDEWMSMGSMDMGTDKAKASDAPKESPKAASGHDMGNMAGMDHSKMESNKDASKDASKEAKADDHSGMNMAEHDMSMYDMYTINGKSGDAIDKLVIKEGDKVRIRLINAGYITHKMHLHGHEFKVIALDGQPVNSPAVIQDQAIAIAPGERYDIEFTANNPGSWLLEEHGTEDRMKNMRAVIQYEGSTKQTDQSNMAEKLPEFDLASYGKQSQTKFSVDQKFDQEVMMNLNTAMKGNEMVYTINDKIFPDTDPIKVKKGEKVKVTFVNKSPKDDHPMHLHGHFFQVISKNGQPLTGAPVIKDTLNVKPGETYVIAFKADNPGDWMFHCHDLHHASTGMMSEVHYSDYTKEYKPDPTVPNKPE
ncbi:multicopper oxidase family protein [Paenibacillus sp. N1-5-1-14]|uniref:multicopper oxidase family protein n=1 Tax=Paenibacillus radicibacter TaxID=2972488 RepID=UPI0021590F2E|nr:multicopper oxidase family protein [Paenibacillus radicibacter]MCR8644348.1 multicopper oxidase family protein [Paenibacillus radicibacter]